MPPIEFNNLITYILCGWLAIVLIVCAITDLRQRRIPNLLTYPTVLAALSVYCYIGYWDGLLFSFAGLAFGFAVFLPAYLLGGMGAGDVKLMSAVGAVLGLKQTAVCFLFIAICGGIMALGIMIHRRNLKETIIKTFLSILYIGAHKDASLLKVDKNKISREGIPYGVAIASGVLLFFSYVVVYKKTLSAFLVI